MAMVSADPLFGRGESVVNDEVGCWGEGEEGEMTSSFRSELSEL